MSKGSSPAKIPMLAKKSLEKKSTMSHSQTSNLAGRASQRPSCLPAGKQYFPGLCPEKKGAGSCKDPALVTDSGLFGRIRCGDGWGCRRLNYRGGLALAGQTARLHRSEERRVG